MMKKLFITLMLALMAWLVFADNYTIGDGINGTSAAPFNGNFEYHWSKILYSKDEINAAGLNDADNFTKIGFYVHNSPNNYVMENQYVYARHTDEAALDTSYPGTAGFQLLYHGTNTYNGGGWYYIEFDTPFAWNNTQNIEFLFENRNGARPAGYPTFRYASSNPNYRTVHKGLNGSFPEVVGARTFNRPNTRLVTAVTTAPDNPALVYPADGAEMISTVTTLSWSTGNIDPDGYRLSLWTNDPADYLVQNLDIEDVNSWTTPELQTNSTYYWKVVPYNQFGNATDSPVWSFSTLPEGMVIIGRDALNWSIPISPTRDFTYSQSIFLQEEINMPNQAIEKIAFYWNGAVAAPYSNHLKVSIGYKDTDVFANNKDWLPQSELFEVFDGEIALEAVEGWVDIVFDVPFVYDNSRNLVVAVQETKLGSDSYLGFFHNTQTPGANRTVYVTQDDIPLDMYHLPNAYIISYIPNIRMNFGDIPQEPALMLSRFDLNFGKVFQNEESDWQELRILNAGGGTLQIDAGELSIIGPHASMFELDSTNLPASLGAGESVSLAVRINATDGGDLQATLRLSHGGEEYDISLVANAYSSGIRVFGDGTSNLSLPVHPYYFYSYSQSIFLQEEINVPDKCIDKVYYYWNGVGSGDGSNLWNLYMGYTTEDAFETVEDWVPLSQLELMFSGRVDVPAREGWVEVALEHPFIYDNMRNLVIAVRDLDPDYGNNYQFFFSTNTPNDNRSIYYMDYYDPIDPANPPTGYLAQGYPNVMLTFEDIPETAILSLGANSMDFGALLQEIPSDWQNLRLTNSGVGNLQLTTNDVSFIGFAADMYEYDTSYFPINLDTGESLDLPIRITATDEGELSATLRFVFAGQNHDVELTALGLQAGSVITGQGTVGWRHPFGYNMDYEVTATVYTEEQVGSIGILDKIGWFALSTGNAQIPYRIYAGTANYSSFSNQTWYDLSSSLTLVKEGIHAFDTLGWNIFDLDTPIPYAGGNLVIAVYTTYGSTGAWPDVELSYTVKDNNCTAMWLPGWNPLENSGEHFSYQSDALLHFRHGDDPAAAPIINFPANGATGLALEGFDLQWTPDLVAGGTPTYYSVFLSQDEESIFDDYMFETTNRTFNPVTEGGIEFENSQRWYWAVEAVNQAGSGVSEVHSFAIINPPPQISVNPLSLSENLEVGQSSTQNITISNPGQLPLEYSIGISEDQARANHNLVINNQTSNPEAARFSEQDINADATSLPANRELYDLQFAFPAAVRTGEYAVVYDGSYIYTSRWSGAGEFYRYSIDGEHLNTLTIQNVGGIRDLTYDGTYFYGVDTSNTIYVMDFDNAELIRTITAPTTPRGIAYDPHTNGLWLTNAWAGPLSLINMDGELIRTLNTSALSMAGIAYDRFSGDSGIWINSQVGDLKNTLIKIDSSTGAILSTYSLDENAYPGINASSIAGGIDVVDGLAPGYATILGMVQNELIYGLELCSTISWVQVSPVSGTVPAGEARDVDVHFNAIQQAPGNYTGSLAIRHNAPSETVEIPLSLSITGTWQPEFSISPLSWDFGSVEELNPVQKQFTIRNVGGPYLTINEGDIYLANDTESNFQIIAEDLPVTLVNNASYRFDVVFSPQSTGAKTANLMVQDNLTRELHTCQLAGTGIPENVGRPVGLEATVLQQEHVGLLWANVYGKPGEPSWVHYDEVATGNAIGAGAGAEFEVAAKFTIETMQDYAGMQISQFMYYPNSSAATYIMQIWTGDDASIAPETVVYQQPLSQDVGSLNTVQLNTPYLITGDTAVWIGYKVEVPAGTPQADTFAAGCDNGPAVSGLGNLIRHGGTWFKLTDLNDDLTSNWNIRAYVDTANSTLASRNAQLNIPVINQEINREYLQNHPVQALHAVNPNQRALRGFNVYRNDTQINSELISTLYYLDENLVPGSYEYAVQAVYYSYTSPLSAPVSVDITVSNPLTMPFVEDWSSEGFDANMWAPGSANWMVVTDYGLSAPSAEFNWFPATQNYTIPLSSYTIDGSGIDSMYLSFDLALDVYSLATENILYAEVWDGSEWHLLGGYSSVYGDLSWSRFAYDITPYAANRQFKIRFVAAGDDTYDINYWNLDNIKVSAMPAFVSPITDLNLVKEDGNMLFSWTDVPDAEWYMVYAADQPQGDYQALGFVETNQLTLPFDLFEGSRQFIKITAGVGPFPETERAGRIPALNQ